MINLILDKITGFEAYNPFEILDNRNIIFYDSTFTNKIEKGLKLQFNLPKGEYIVNGYIHQLGKPIIYNRIKLPPKQRDLGKKDYLIIWGNNSNKCTVFHKAGLIVFDHAFKKAPKYILQDIYSHELGHRFYHSEKFADMFATNRMLDLGFNPSQIGRASIISLSNKFEGLKRKKHKVKKVLTVKYNQK